MALHRQGANGKASADRRHAGALPTRAFLLVARRRAAALGTAKLLNRLVPPRVDLFCRQSPWGRPPRLSTRAGNTAKAVANGSTVRLCRPERS